MKPPSLSGEPPEPPPAPNGGTPYKYEPRPTDDEILLKGRGLRVFGLIASAIVVLLVAGYKVIQRRQEVEVRIPPAQYLSTSPWTEGPGVSIAPAFSTDGKLVAYASDREGSGNFAIWMRPYPSGAPRRLTNEEFNATDPDFSPDNTEIVYHSDRDGGGIYIAPVSGTGQPRLLAKGGMRPRFSSNGKWIAYYAASSEGETTARSTVGTLYIIAPAGGAPKRIRPDFPDARNPVWFPGGEFLLFEGRNGTGITDWWVTPIDNGVVTRTHAFEKLNGSVRAHTAPMRWDRDIILFSGTDQTNLHVWELAIAPQSWQASGTPQALTNGEGIEESAAVSRDGRMMFTKMQVSVNIWSLPLDADSGKPTGALQPITKDRALNLAPTAGPNGTKVVYVSDRTGSRDVWVHDLKTGHDFSATTFHNIAYRPVLSADENRVAYRTAIIGGQCAIILRDLTGGASREVPSGCFNIWDWSPDGSSLLIYDSAEAVVSAQLLKINSGRRQPLISHPKFSLLDSGFSRDGRWIAFTAALSPATSEVFVAPFHDAAIKEAEWIPITRNGGFSAWSPDSSTLYFHSKRDGFHCIWAQKLNTARQPVGESSPILHLHSVSFGMYMIKPNDFRMSVTKDRLLLNLASETANLWISDKRE